MLQPQLKLIHTREEEEDAGLHELDICQVERRPKRQRSSLNQENGADLKCNVLVIGSAAGRPNFKEHIERQEGQGSVDNEMHYIESMQKVREFCEKMQRCLNSIFTAQNSLNQTLEVSLLDPPLLRTPLTEAQFGSKQEFSEIWNNIQTSDEYVESYVAGCLSQTGHFEK